MKTAASLSLITAISLFSGLLLYIPKYGNANKMTKTIRTITGMVEYEQEKKSSNQEVKTTETQEPNTNPPSQDEDKISPAIENINSEYQDSNDNPKSSNNSHTTGDSEIVHSVNTNRNGTKMFTVTIFKQGALTNLPDKKPTFHGLEISVHTAWNIIFNELVKVFLSDSGDFLGGYYTRMPVYISIVFELIKIAYPNQFDFDTELDGINTIFLEQLISEFQELQEKYETKSNWEINYEKDTKSSLECIEKCGQANEDFFDLKSFKDQMNRNLLKLGESNPNIGEDYDIDIFDYMNQYFKDFSMLQAFLSLNPLSLCKNCRFVKQHDLFLRRLKEFYAHHMIWGNFQTFNALKANLIPDRFSLRILTRHGQRDVPFVKSFTWKDEKIIENHNDDKVSTSGEK